MHCRTDLGHNPGRSDNPDRLVPNTSLRTFREEVLDEVQRQGFIERKSSAEGAFTSPLIWQVVRSAIVSSQKAPNGHIFIEAAENFVTGQPFAKRLGLGFTVEISEHGREGSRRGS